MVVDLHNHTKYCKHATGEMEEFVKEAIVKGVDVFGFSCHAPMSFDSDHRMNFEEMLVYEVEIDRLKQKYDKEIEILSAYEVDYLKGYLEECVLKRDVDYLIGSVHFINQWGFDNPSSIFEYKNRNIDEVYKEYYTLMLEMVNSGHFDIVGHFDLIKVFNFLPNNLPTNEIDELLKAIKISNMTIEINSSGLRKPVSQTYPSEDILKMAYAYDIPITFSSDAHLVEHIGFGREDAFVMAKNIGYSRCVKYKKRDREFVEF